MSEVRGFGFNPGCLRMLAYVPEGLEPNAPLVVVLHGCTQRAGEHARAAGWLTLADRLGFAVLAPEQDPKNNPNRCFNWFEPGDAARGEGEAASIHAMTQHLVRTLRLDPARVFITGLSAGGAMTAVLLATYPETFAGGAVVAGLPFGVAGNVQQAMAAMHRATPLSGAELGALIARAAPAASRTPRLAIWHGQADMTVASSNARAVARQWAAAHGLSDQASEVQVYGGWTRSVWHDADGAVMVECNMLAGLGHGAPVATGGPDPIGEVAAFMLEAGVSSALEIARFWGLAPAGETPRLDVGAPKGSMREPAAHASNVGETIMAALKQHVPADIQQTIAKALASAGLMR